jgi:hypothetical protein
LAATPSPFGFFPISDYPADTKKGGIPEGSAAEKLSLAHRSAIPMAIARRRARRQFDGGGVRRRRPSN